MTGTPGAVASRVWTDDQLLDALRSAATELGQPLRTADFAKWACGAPERPSYEVVLWSFVRWNDALTLAGLRPARNRRRPPWAPDPTPRLPPLERSQRGG